MAAADCDRSTLDAETGGVAEPSHRFAPGDRVRWHNPPLCMGTVLKHNGSRCKVQWDTGEVRRDDPSKLRLVRPADEPARNVTGLINIIETRIIGVRPEDQDVELEDADWRAIVAALERDQLRRNIAAARATIAQKASSSDELDRAGWPPKLENKG